jgi:DNA-directed RNA polymerase subunit omega
MQIPSRHRFALDLTVSGGLVARVTVEDCLTNVTDQFALVHLASLRYRQLHKGATCLVGPTDNKLVVTSLREIAAGKVRFRENVAEALIKAQPKLVSQRLRNISGGEEAGADELM